MPPRRSNAVKSEKEKGKEKEKIADTGVEVPVATPIPPHALPDLPSLQSLEVDPFGSDFSDPEGEDDHQRVPSPQSAFPPDASLMSLPSPMPTATRSLRRQSEKTIRDLGADITVAKKKQPAVRKSKKPLPVEQEQPSILAPAPLPSSDATNRLAALTAVVSNLEARMDALDSSHKAHLTDVGKLSAQVDLAMSVTKPLSGKRIATEAALQKLEAAHFDTRTAVVAMQKKIPRLTAAMEGIDTTVDKHIAPLASHVDSLDSSVVALESNIHQLEDDVLNARDRLPQLPRLSDPLDHIPATHSHPPDHSSMPEDESARGSLGKRKRVTSPLPTPYPTREVDEGGHFRSRDSTVEADILFGPINPGDPLTRARDAMVACGMDPKLVVSARVAEQTDFIVVRVRSQDVAHDFVRVVRQLKDTVFRMVKDVKVLAGTVPSSSRRYVR
ncbi:hypothetical protein CVT26_005643 [Gymnopilus dilepis]|uniref:Uncharacterized protein n=1 Tax=Gymnopilus dilepis TaxID=231916 RepID=A0A409WYU7_9AGAR|nr:hypothetical protein CVT26_005643 [Gymnopilus dilepis]